MSELTDKEQKEAWSVVEALDSSDFLFPEFSAWLKTNGFQIEDIGRWWWYKGVYGFIQLEHLLLNKDKEDTVVQCIYRPYTDKNHRIGLLNEGKSASGKILQKIKLDLLKQYRFNQVESFVKQVIWDKTGEVVETTHMKLKDDLKLDEIDLPGVIMAVEDEYDIEISDEDAASFESVEDIISFVRKEKKISKE